MTEASPDAGFFTPETTTSVLEVSSETPQPSPLHQTRLFPAATRTTSNNNEDADDDEMLTDGMPRYMQRTNAATLNMNDVHEADEEEGDGDSAADATEINDLDEAAEESLRERLQVLIKCEDTVEQAVRDDVPNGIFLKGLSADIAMPTAPADWKPDAPKVHKNEPAFDDIDNPGKWPQYTYRPTFDKKTGLYRHHKLPTGATPVRPNGEGKRVVDDWEFFYDEYVPDLDASNRSSAIPTNLFPEERKGKLDYNLLKELKLTKEKILTCDSLFFLQLILPLCDPKKSGIEDDP